MKLFYADLILNHSKMVFQIVRWTYGQHFDIHMIHRGNFVSQKIRNDIKNGEKQQYK